MAYPQLPEYSSLSEKLICYAQLMHEYGSKDISAILEKSESEIRKAIENLKRLPINEALAQNEPNELELIKLKRPNGPRKIWNNFDKVKYLEKLEGALLGRFAGCTLGAPVEFWDIQKMQNLAKENNMDFPPNNYWTYVPEPFEKRYLISPRENYTRNKMDGVPVDDDIVYTILGLLTVEDFGKNFSIPDVGKSWQKYLPYACTAEKIALENLNKGIDAFKSGELNNPYCEWIGALIRSDPWGYLAPGWPEKAAEMAYKDAFISHRRQGIYGEMFFAAAISAAFAIDDPIEAIKIGLTEIPRECALAKAVSWALEISGGIKNYQQAREIVENQFIGMSKVHTINNTSLVILGIIIGNMDFTRTIGEIVAMGMDNDCTAATAGSLFGAAYGKKAIPEFWYKPFNNKIHTYLQGIPVIRISDLIKRFSDQAKNIFQNQ